jgi:hypothetical protein
VSHGPSLIAKYCAQGLGPVDAKMLRLYPAGASPGTACHMTAAALAWVLCDADVLPPYTTDWRRASPGKGFGGVCVVARALDGDWEDTDHVALFIGNTVFDSCWREQRTLGERPTILAEWDRESLRYIQLPVSFKGLEIRVSNAIGTCPWHAPLVRRATQTLTVASRRPCAPLLLPRARLLLAAG